MSFQDTILDIVARLKSWFFFAERSDVILAGVFIILIFLFRKPLASFVMSSVNKLMTRLSVGLPDHALNELKKTVSVLLVTGSLFIAAEIVQLPVFADGFVRKILASIAIIAVFSGWYNLCGPMISLISGEGLIELKVGTSWMERVSRFAVVLFGFSALLTVWEVDISGAMTGVGVLGAGVAIATQDLIRNLVAGMYNQSEKRFSVGDVVEIEDAFIGTVEQIDLRSTLLRGFDQIPRYIPNSQLANAVVLNYTQLLKRRVKMTIPFVMSCTAEQMEQVLAALRDHLYNSGDFDTDDGAPLYVCIEGMSDSAILVMFYARTPTADYNYYLEVTERLTLKVLEISREYGAALAYPTQSLEMATPPNPA